MREALKVFTFFVSLIVGANAIAWGIDMLHIRHDGDFLVVLGGCGLLSSLFFVWFASHSITRLIWMASISYAFLLIGFDAHIEFHKVYGSHMGLKAFILALFTTF